MNPVCCWKKAATGVSPEFQPARLAGRFGTYWTWHWQSGSGGNSGPRLSCIPHSAVLQLWQDARNLRPKQAKQTGRSAKMGPQEMTRRFILAALIFYFVAMWQRNRNIVLLESISNLADEHAAIITQILVAGLQVPAAARTCWVNQLHRTLGPTWDTEVWPLLSDIQVWTSYRVTKQTFR